MMKLPHAKLSELSRAAQLKRVADGTHHLLSGEIQRKSSKKRLEAGTHNFLGSELQRKRVQSGTHHLLGGELQRKQVADGTHHLLSGKIQRKSSKKRLEAGTHNFIRPWTCEHCGKEGKGTGYSRYPGDKCRSRL